MEKTALITGAANGIGKEFADLHASKGGNLVLIDINSNGLERLRHALKAVYKVEIYTIVKDLSQISAGQEIYNEVKEKGFKIDYLINNAGFGGIGKFHERPWENDLAMIQVNVIALASLIRHFLPDFVARNSGRILNVSSAVSLVPGPNQAVYFASKAFVTSLTRSIYGELSDTNVTITALLPGATDTGFGSHSGMDRTDAYKKLAYASSVAQDGYEAMIEGKLEVISGLPCSQKVELSLPHFCRRKCLLTESKKNKKSKSSLHSH